jgi:hypothetical protein
VLSNTIIVPEFAASKKQNSAEMSKGFLLTKRWKRGGLVERKIVFLVWKSVAWICRGCVDEGGEAGSCGIHTSG